MKTPPVVILFAVRLMSAATQSDAKTKPHATPDLTRLPAESLIARFQDESATSIQEDEVGRKWDAALNHEKDVPEYVRAYDTFLQKMAADPALQLPAGQP